MALRLCVIIVWALDAFTVLIMCHAPQLPRRNGAYICPSDFQPWYNVCSQTALRRPLCMRGTVSSIEAYLPNIQRLTVPEARSDMLLRVAVLTLSHGYFVEREQHPVLRAAFRTKNLPSFHLAQRCMYRVLYRPFTGCHLFTDILPQGFEKHSIAVLRLV